MKPGFAEFVEAHGRAMVLVVLSFALASLHFQAADFDLPADGLSLLVTPVIFYLLRSRTQRAN